MPFGGQICPEPAFFELGSHWGRRCAISMGRARAFRRPTMLVRPRRSRFSRYVVTAWEFLLCFPRGLVQEKNRPGLVTSYAKKRCYYGENTTQNDTRVRRKSLRKPVACDYCDLPRRCRARWTKTTPAREGRAKPERRATNSNKMAHVRSPLPRHHSYSRERC